MYKAVKLRSDLFKHIMNSENISVGSNLSGLVIAVTTARAMALVSDKHTKNAPILFMGRFSQKRLVRGLTFGVVKYA